MKHPKETEFSNLREKAGLSIEETAERLGVTPRTIYRWDKGETRPNPLALNELKTSATAATDLHQLHAPAFRFIDLFAGIGGLRLGFEAVGGKSVFTSEWDMPCRTTYQTNFNCDHPVVGDIRDVDLEDVPPYDILVAGFPCQPFSIAGVSKKNALHRPHGFRCDIQGTLFFDVARFLKVHRPPAFLLENVKNLVNHDKGRTFAVIMRTLQKELRYNVHCRVIDAMGWLPQHRERIFIAGFRTDTGFSFDSLPVPDPAQGPQLHSILHPEDGTDPPEPPFTKGKNGRVAEKYTLSAHLWQYLQDYAAKHRAKGNGFGFGLVGPDDVARTLSARYYKDGSEILIGQPGSRPRRLTPRECARLMGFDEPGKPPFKIPVSDTQAYKQFGNAVAVPVAKAVARHMQPHIPSAMQLPDPASEPQLPLDFPAMKSEALA